MANNKYQYETSPRKLEPDYKREKKTNKNRMKVVENVPRQRVEVSTEQRKKQFKLMLIVIAVFALLLTISYRNSQINEEFNKVQTLKRELSSLQKENEQTKVTIENGLNLNNVEKLAKEKLGMQKLTTKQSIYVTLPKKDYTESATEKVVINKEQNWFEQIINKFFNKQN